MAVLTGNKRQHLKGHAPRLPTIVRVGKGEATASVAEETKKSLASHELIKVRIETDDSSARREIAEKLASATDAHLAATIGKIAILYREREEKPAIKLPQ